MPFFPSSSLFQKNNARNIIYMAVLIFLKCLDPRKNVYSRTSSQAGCNLAGQLLLYFKQLLDNFTVSRRTVALENFLEHFFVSRKRTNEVEPEMFHPAKYVAGA
jgi:hypothetical protein